MNKKIWSGLASLGGVMLVITALWLTLPQTSPALERQQASNSATESLTQGFTLEGQITYRDVLGKILDGAVFRSYRQEDIYFVLPAQASPMTINSVQFGLISKTGSYAGQVNLTLEVLDQETGVLQQVLAQAGPNWTEASHIWRDLPLDTSYNINPNEFLAFHFALNGEPGGDLRLEPMFKVDVQPEKLRLARSQNQDAVLWRSGFTLEAIPSQAALHGRLLEVAGTFRSNRDVDNVHYVFPSAGVPNQLQSTQFKIISKTGSYAGQSTLSLVVYSSTGQEKYTLSDALDLSDVPANTWQSLNLSASDSIAAGDLLAAKVSFSDGSAGNLDLRLAFEAELLAQAEPRRFYLPLIFLR